MEIVTNGEKVVENCKSGCMQGDYRYMVKEAPAMYPTKEEWADPMAYIEKIRVERGGEKAGIVKIIPPRDFNPPFMIDKDKLSFNTRIQTIKMIEPNSRVERLFLEKLRKFMFRKGTPLNMERLFMFSAADTGNCKPYHNSTGKSTVGSAASFDLDESDNFDRIYYMPNLFKLFKAVVSRGGWHGHQQEGNIAGVRISDELWVDIAKEVLDFRVLPSNHPFHDQLSIKYGKMLHDVYELHLADFEKAILYNIWPIVAKDNSSSSSMDSEPLTKTQKISHDNEGSRKAFKSEREEHETVDSIIDSISKITKDVSIEVMKAAIAIEKANKVASCISKGLPVPDDAKGLMIDINILTPHEMQKLQRPSKAIDKITVGIEFWKYFPEYGCAWPGVVESVIRGSNPRKWRVRFTSKESKQATKSGISYHRNRNQMRSQKRVREKDESSDGEDSQDEESKSGRNNTSSIENVLNSIASSSKYKCEHCGMHFLQQRRLADHLKTCSSYSSNKNGTKDANVEGMETTGGRTSSRRGTNKKKSETIPTNRNNENAESVTFSTPKSFIEKIDENSLFLLISSGETPEEAEDAIVHGICQVCNRANRLEDMLICDGCNFGYHFFCLKPPLANVPEGDWFCPLCLEQEGQEHPGIDFWFDDFKGMLQEYEGFISDAEDSDDSDNDDIGGPIGDMDIVGDSEDDVELYLTNRKQQINEKKNHPSNYSACVRAAGYNQLKTFGHDHGEFTAFNEYEAQANEFKEKYITESWDKKQNDEVKLDKRTVKEREEMHPWALFNSLSVNEKDSVMEREFWKILSCPSSVGITKDASTFPVLISDDIKPEYGSDLDTGVIGSGFPTRAKFAEILSKKVLSPTQDVIENLQKVQVYADHGWNIANIPSVKGSLLQYVDADIMGIIVPWIYIGMCFSSFSWHTEDEYFNSINYLHWGDAKSWWGVSGLDAEKFEQTAKKIAPELFEARPDLLTGLVTMFHPDELAEMGVPVYHTVQHAGEFVVTYPRAYHGGFNHGLNCAEAVNFATTSWLPYGKKCQERYKALRKNPVIAYDSLLYKVALMCIERKESVETAQKILPFIENMIEEQKNGREKVKVLVKRTITAGSPGESTTTSNLSSPTPQLTTASELQEKSGNFCTPIKDVNSNTSHLLLSRNQYANIVDKLRKGSTPQSKQSLLQKLQNSKGKSKTSSNNNSNNSANDRQRGISTSSDKGNGNMMMRSMGLAKVFGDIPQCYFCKCYCPLSHVRTESSHTMPNDNNAVVACLDHARILKAELEQICQEANTPVLNLELVEYFSINQLEEMLKHLINRALDVVLWKLEVRNFLEGTKDQDINLETITSSKALGLLHESPVHIASLITQAKERKKNASMEIEYAASKDDQSNSLSLPLSQAKKIYASGVTKSSSVKDEAEPLHQEIQATEAYIKNIISILPNPRRKAANIDERYQYTLDDATKMLHQGKEFIFFPDNDQKIDQLIALIDVANKWELEAAELLSKISNTSNQSSSAVEQLIISLRNLVDTINRDVQLELNSRRGVHKALSEMEWRLKAQSMLNNLICESEVAQSRKKNEYAALTQAEQMIESYPSPINNGMQVEKENIYPLEHERLLEAVAITKKWIASIDVVMKSVDPDVLEELFEDYVEKGKVPLQPPQSLLTELDKKNREVQRWVTKVREITNANTSADEKKTSKLTKLNADITKLGINPASKDAVQLKKIIAEVHSWKQQIRNAFIGESGLVLMKRKGSYHSHSVTTIQGRSQSLSSTGSSDEGPDNGESNDDGYLAIALQHIDPSLLSSKECLDDHFIVKETTSAKKARESKKKKEGKANELYCICRGELDGVHKKEECIACDTCGEWYHRSCVGLSNIPLDTIDKYTCIKCADPSSSYKYIKELTNPKKIRPLFCICQMPYLDNGVTMVACDNCNQWFHPACIGVHRDYVQEFQSSSDPFYCPSCCKKLDTPFIDGTGLNGYGAKIKQYLTRSRLAKEYIIRSGYNEVGLSKAIELIRLCPMEYASGSLEFNHLQTSINASSAWALSLLSKIQASKNGISLASIFTIDLWDMCDSELLLRVKPPTILMDMIKMELWFRYIVNLYKTGQKSAMDKNIELLKKISIEQGFFDLLMRESSTNAILFPRSKYEWEHLITTFKGISGNNTCNYLVNDRVFVIGRNEAGVITEIFNEQQDENQMFPSIMAKVKMDESSSEIVCPVDMLIKEQIQSDANEHLEAIQLRQKIFNEIIKPESSRTSSTESNHIDIDVSHKENHFQSQEITSTVDNHEKEEESYCICKQPEVPGILMIGCDAEKEGCSVWYHPECIGIDPKKLPESFICSNCVSKP